MHRGVRVDVDPSPGPHLSTDYHWVIGLTVKRHICRLNCNWKSLTLYLTDGSTSTELLTDQWLFGLLWLRFKRTVTYRSVLECF